MAELSIVAAAPNIDTWSAFWSLYPRREAKKDALRAWSKISGSEHNAILEAVVAWRNVWRQQNRCTQHIPLPASWLNGERWTDEIPAELQTHSKAVATASLRAQVDVPAGCDRVPIPLGVQKVLDQLKAKRT